jgi:hypothetical protein
VLMPRGHADVPHDSEDSGNGLARIGGLGGSIDAERRAGAKRSAAHWCPAASSRPRVGFQYSCCAPPPALLGEITYR